MLHVNYFDETQRDKIIRKRNFETKLGEKVVCVKPTHSAVELYEAFKNSSASYVLLGFPEDIGVRANYGRGGSHSAWQPTLETLLNIQSNSFLDGSEVIILGNVIFDDLLEIAKDYSIKNSTHIEALRQLTHEIDKRISPIIELIAKAGKKIIAVGGGHNNAYPIIKGITNVVSQKLNVLNIDAHADFRPLEGRHSGNGFSYAYSENMLKSYAAIGIHENYCGEAIFQKFHNNETLNMFTYENIFLREKQTMLEISNDLLREFGKESWGLEIDLDSIQNIPTSAKTSSGMLPVEVRKFIYDFCANANTHYLHIAEGAPILSHIKTDNKTGKLISYLITDYIKANR